MYLWYKALSNFTNLKTRNLTVIFHSSIRDLAKYLTKQRPLNHADVINKLLAEPVINHIYEDLKQLNH